MQGLPPKEDSTLPPQHELATMSSAALDALIAKETAARRAR
jgi:hypothetical protein